MCRSEIADPPDLRSVSCPCGAVFDGRGAPLAYWLGAGFLCALVLAGLWIIAWQNRARKLAERYGEEIQRVAPDLAGIPKISLAENTPDTAIEEFFERARPQDGQWVHVFLPAQTPYRLQETVLRAAAKRGLKVHFFADESRRLTLRFSTTDPERILFVEHFTLLHGWQSHDLDVRTGEDNTQGGNLFYASYRNLEPGNVRMVLGLQVTCLERTPGRLVLEIDRTSESICFGPGDYSLKPGLRVGLPGDRWVAVTSVVPGKASVEVSDPEGRETVVLTPAAPEQKVKSVALKLHLQSQTSALLIELP